MKSDELKLNQLVFQYTDIKMKPCRVKGFTSDRVWIINSDGDLLQFEKQYAMKTYGVIYGTRKH